MIEHARQFNEAVSVLIELEGMKAENRQRIAEGKSLAYVEDDFLELLNKYSLGYNSCVEKFRNFY